jgi:membrane-bound lytic murein transglycosylase D
MSRDFARNRNLPGVKNFVNIYTTGKRRGDLMAFIKNANPFRPMLEAVGSRLDVSPSFAYLTVIESRYMKSGNYQIEPINSAGAYGAFQFKPDTARSVGMRVDGGEDERKYFAPSACGAATYIGSLVNTFMNSDTTLAILGYNQGSGGAARAIYCSYEDRSQCKSRNWNRYLKFAKNYSFKYADMENVTAIPKEQRDYVDAKLAIYFVLSDMARYGLSIPSSAPRILPNNGSVFPPQEIHNPSCRAAINSLTGT